MSEEKKANLALVPPQREQSMAIARTNVSINGMGELFQYARALSTLGAGIVPKAYVGNENAIAACIVTGAELGIGAMESLRSIYLVDGKPQLAAELMMRIAIQRGVTVEWLSLTDDEARAKFRRPGFPDHVGAWTMEDAKRAGVAGKDVWKKYPRAMLRARCVSESLRAWAPDVLGAGVYVEGEFDGETGVGAPGAQPPPRAVEATVIRDTKPTKMRLTDTSNADELLAWCKSNAPVIAKANEKSQGEARLGIRVAAERIGCPVGPMLVAAGLERADDYDPSTGEVAPDQEPGAHG